MREPQQERSRATRARLLDAAIECLAEHGWAGTTVLVVAERAGVSRGAAQHYFPTRESLVAEAVAHMSEMRSGLRDGGSVGGVSNGSIESLPGDGDRETEAVLQTLFSLYSGPVFRAALQLWIAAAADEALRAQIAPLEVELGRQAHRLAVALLRVDESRPGVREMVQATLDLVRGLGLADLLTDDSTRRARVLRQWAWTLDSVLKPEP